MLMMLIIDILVNVFIDIKDFNPLEFVDDTEYEKKNLEASIINNHCNMTLKEVLQVDEVIMKGQL